MTTIAQTSAAFVVDGVERQAAIADKDKWTVASSIQKLVGKKLKIEAFSRSGCQFSDIGNCCPNGLLGTFLTAYNYHHPLFITPDAIWVTIAQGIASHINANAEALRRKFVTHDGKKEILIQRDGFVKGSPENDWEGCFSEFSLQIRKHIPPEVHALVAAEFSTTGAVELAVSEITLMDAMQAYFSYGMMTACGLPEVTLTGKVEDWRAIRHRVGQIEKLIDSGLSFWTTPLAETCDQFIRAAEGNPDIPWWKDFVKEESAGSGDTRISGHMMSLVPYLGSKKIHQNPLLDNSNSKYVYTRSSEFPSSLSKAPVTWYYYGQEIELDFVGGVVGTGVHGDGVFPKIGWAIVEKKKEKKD